MPITYDAYGDESDPGPFPIPQNAPVEGGAGATGDRHVIAVQQGTCELFELFAARPSGAGWIAGSGARFDLRSNALRPLGWTSADAAGLPIFAGLVRYEEVAAGQIRHAIRITMSRTQAGLHPAGDPPRVESHRPDLPADGPAAAVEGRATTCRSSPGRHG